MQTSNPVINFCSTTWPRYWHYISIYIYTSSKYTYLPGIKIFSTDVLSSKIGFDAVVQKFKTLHKVQKHDTRSSGGLWIYDLQRNGREMENYTYDCTSYTSLIHLFISYTSQNFGILFYTPDTTDTPPILADLVSTWC